MLPENYALLTAEERAMVRESEIGGSILLDVHRFRDLLSTLAAARRERDDIAQTLGDTQADRDQTWLDLGRCQRALAEARAETAHLKSLLQEHGIEGV